MWFHEVARDHTNKNAWAGTHLNQITFEMLTDTGQFNAIEAQIQCLPMLHEQLKTVALEIQDWITPQEEPTGSYTKILQGPNENYADFLARLETAISHTVIREEAKKQLKRLLPYENTNKKCQKAIASIHGLDYYWLFKACYNLSSKTQKIQMLAKTMAACFKRKNKRCFTCGDKNHLKRECPKKGNKKPPKNCPHCHKKQTHKKYTGPKIVNLNLILKKKQNKNYSRKLQTGDPPRFPSTKTRDKFHLFPQTLNIQQCCPRYSSPKLL